MTKEITISKVLMDALDVSIRNLADLLNREVENEHRIVQSNVYKLKDLMKELYSNARLLHPEQFTAVMDKDAMLIVQADLVKQIETLRAIPLNDDNRVKNTIAILTLEKKLKKINDRISNFKEVKE